MSVETTWQLLCDTCGENSGNRFPSGGDLKPSQHRKALAEVGWTSQQIGAVMTDRCDKCNADPRQRKTNRKRRL